MRIYFTKKAGDCWKNGAKGNFSLWFNKYVPVYIDDKKGTISFSSKNHPQNIYVSEYSKRKHPDINSLLSKKREMQEQFAANLAHKYRVVTIRIKLSTPLIVGMGESHPSENGMIFDHNIGVPYIPASTIKGLLRYHYTKQYLENLEISGKIENAPCIIMKDGIPLALDDSGTEIPKIFGGSISDGSDGAQDKSGNVIILDAYPEDIPDIGVDIMNNHYSGYYADKGEKPPSDTYNPNPVNFLVVKPGTRFSFVMIIKSKATDYYDQLIKSCEEMLVNGIGAKTALGYGRFDWKKYRKDREIEDERARKKKLDEDARKQKEADEQMAAKAKAEENKKKAQQKKEAKEKREAEKAAKIKAQQEKEAKERAEALAKGIAGFKDVKYFNALKGMRYIVEDHTLSEDELAILEGVINCLYLKDKKDKKWKKRNEGYWKAIGQWIGGELKNRWFKEFTGK